MKFQYHIIEKEKLLCTLRVAIILYIDITKTHQKFDNILKIDCHTP